MPRPSQPQLPQAGRHKIPPPTHTQVSCIQYTRYVPPLRGAIAGPAAEAGHAQRGSRPGGVAALRFTPLPHLAVVWGGLRLRGGPGRGRARAPARLLGRPSPRKGSPSAAGSSSPVRREGSGLRRGGARSFPGAGRPGRRDLTAPRRAPPPRADAFRARGARAAQPRSLQCVVGPGRPAGTGEQCRYFLHPSVCIPPTPPLISLTFHILPAPSLPLASISPLCVFLLIFLFLLYCLHLFTTYTEKLILN